METLSLFLLKSIVVSGVLTTWYLLGLCGHRLHRYNRFFLLSILFASLTIPFLHFRLFSIPHAVSGRFAPVALFGQSAGDLGALPALPQANQGEQYWQAISAIIATCISFALLIILSIRIIKVRRMCRQYAVIQVEGINLVLTDLPNAPFTFLGYVFWNRSVSLQDETGQLIFRHELTHIQQGHTYDKLVCQALTCIFWFNPFYWIIQKELNIVHEFVADEYAVGNSDTGAFARMLLRTYDNGSYLVPEHYFFSSTVKRRLAMLQNAANTRYAAFRRFMVVPLIASTILLFSFDVRNTSGDIAPAKRKIVLLLDAGHGGTDAGEQAGGYAEKEICLRCARRIKELSPAYNVDVQLTRYNDQYVQLADRMAFSRKISPDVFVSLHIGEQPSPAIEKGDFEIYVSGEDAHAAQSRNYSNSIFQAMAQSGIIPRISTTTGSTHSPGCRCNSCLTEASGHNIENANILAVEKKGLYVLKNAQVPAMVMVLGNIKNLDEMRQLTDNNRMDMLCNAILKGIVAGAQDDTTTDPLHLLPGSRVDARCH